MTTLPPLPPPGLAILPQYLTPHPLHLTLKGSTFSKSMTVTTTHDNRALFRIEGASLSRSHRRAVHDATTGAKLFEVRKAGMGLKRYYAETSENGPRLFETETRTRVFHRARTAVRFANQADGRTRGMVELEFVPGGMGMGDDGVLSWSGGPVVRVQKKSLSLSGEYQLSIAPGMDPALAVAVVVAMIDRAKAQAAANAAASSGG